MKNTKKGKKVLKIVLVICMILAFYGIFNVGNPNSLFKYIIKNRQYDIFITFFFSLSIFFISLFLMKKNDDDNPIIKLLNNEDNLKTIKKLRNQNFSDVQIADSFLSKLGYKKNIFYWLVKKKILKHLKKNS